jgi:hypothetical protein
MVAVANTSAQTVYGGGGNMSDAKLPIFRTAWLSLCDAWRAARAIPKLAAIAFVLILAESTLDDFLAPNEFEGSVVWWQLLRVALTVPFALFTTPLLIAFYRYLLLGDGALRYALDISSPRFRAFFSYYAVMSLAVTASLCFTDPTGPFIKVVGVVIGVLFMLLPAMLFPAIAVDAPQANIANALRDLQPLRALVIGSLALLPLVFAVILVLLTFFGDTEVLPPAIEWPAYIAVLSIFGFTFEMIALALSARFYRAWATRLGRPAGIVE